MKKGKMNSFRHEKADIIHSLVFTQIETERPIFYTKAGQLNEVGSFVSSFYLRGDTEAGSTVWWVEGTATQWSKIQMCRIFNL